MANIYSSCVEPFAHPLLILAHSFFSAIQLIITIPCIWTMSLIDLNYTMTQRHFLKLTHCRYIIDSYEYCFIYLLHPHNILSLLQPWFSPAYISIGHLCLSLSAYVTPLPSLFHTLSVKQSPFPFSWFVTSSTFTSSLNTVQLQCPPYL